MEKIKNILAICIVIILLPYVLTVLLNGTAERTERMNKTGGQVVQVEKNGEKVKVEWNEYILGLVANQMSADYESEALKAQIVIVRTNLYRELDGEDISEHVFTGNYLTIGEMEQTLGHKDFTKTYDKLMKYVSETDNQVIKYEGGLIDAPYHAVSGGTARSGEEAFGSGDYPYLKTADCSGDVESNDYLKATVMTSQEVAAACKEINSEIQVDEADMWNQIQIGEVDSAGYVKKVIIGGVSVPGEKFRAALGLNSSCFTMQQYHSDIRFTTKGLGHGVGMSQYTANAMAKEGKTYQEILTYFYSDTAIENF